MNYLRSIDKTIQLLCCPTDAKRKARFLGLITRRGLVESAGRMKKRGIMKNRFDTLLTIIIQRKFSANARKTIRWRLIDTVFRHCLWTVYLKGIQLITNDLIL